MHSVPASEKQFPIIRAGDVRVVYSGVDPVRFRPDNKAWFRDEIRRQLGLGARQPVLLYVGTGFERNGLRYAIGALRDLPSNTVLIVIGKGRTRWYCALARTWGVGERVVFLGPRDGTEPYYAASDLLVFPTLYEPMGNVVLEAFASGIPAVTSRWSGSAEIVSEGKDGSLIDDPTDPREVASKVVDAMKCVASTDIERQARLKADRFDLSVTVQNLVEVRAGTDTWSRKGE